LAVCGVTLLAVGWAGSVGTLAGQREGHPQGYIDPEKGVILIAFGASTLVLSIMTWFLQCHVTGEDAKVDKLRWKKYETRLYKNVWWFFGSIFFPVSLIMVSVSFACFDDTLAGVPSEHQLEQEPNRRYW
jgi:hypothetical protein